MFAFKQEIIGGILIGLASALPLLFEGRIAGISGYAAGSLRPNTYENKNSLIFIMGLILGGFLWVGMGNPTPQTPSEISNVTWIIAGLLVGFGSRLGGGCTSGHGVCGLGRASQRSFVSVLVFMAMAALVVLGRKMMS